MVYVVAGHHNSNYDGLFCHVFDNEEKMLAKVVDLMSQDMRMSSEEFHKLRETNREDFDEVFLDGGGRTYEECMEEEAYYSEKGYEIIWGSREIK